MKRLSCGAMLGLLLAGAAAAENWPQWRGPSGSGISPERGLPAEWGPERNIAWKAPLRGLGVSSPVVWGDRVFVTYQKGSGVLRTGRHPTFVQEGDPVAAGERPLGGARQEGGPGEKIVFAVAAFDRTTGRELWEYELAAEGDPPAVHEKRNLATPSPVTDGERVYAWFSTGQLAAVGMDGKPVWTRHMGKEYAVFDINWGHASSPAIHEDRLILVCYLGSSSYLLALDKRSGKELWKADRGKGLTSYTTPLVIELPRGPELILNTSEGIEAVDPRSGERLWYFQETNRFPIPAPVFHDGLLYASRGYRSGPYMALRPGGSGDVSKTNLVWHIETGAPYVSSLVYHDGLVYMASELGIVTAVDSKTGERVWRERLGGLFTASPVVADGRVYLFSETGEAVVLKAGRTPEVLARNKLGEQIIASPAVSQGRLFVRSDRHLIAIGGASR